MTPGLVPSLRCYIYIVVLQLSRFDSAASSAVDVKSTCPLSCTCWFLNGSDLVESIGVKCRGKHYMKLTDTSFGKIRKDFVEELDLADNNISVLRSRIFRGFDRLRSLNLSGNKLETLRSDWFDGIGKLERLFLADNPLKFIPERSVGPLAALKYIDLATPSLTCDCNMKWFRRWISNVKKGHWPAKRSKLVVSPSTKCYFPAKFRGVPFVKIKRKQLSCGGRLNPASFVHPRESRVLAQGNMITLKCNVSTMKDDETLEWIKNGASIRSTDAYTMETMFDDDGLFHIAILTIKELGLDDGGEWSCRLETEKGSLEHSVHIFVLRNVSEVACRAEITVDQKGRFLWPDTLPLSTAALPCPYSNGSHVTNASRVCYDDGDWLDPVTDQCGYQSSTHKRLASMRRYAVRGRLEAKEFLRELRNLTLTMNSATSESLNLILQLVEEVAPLTREQEETEIFNIINDLLKIRPRTLRKADHSFRTATRILNILRSSSTSIARTQFAIEDCLVSRKDELGVAIAYVGESAENQSKLKCWRRNSQESQDMYETTASLEIVIDFAVELKIPDLLLPLRFVYYQNGNALTPLIGTNDTNEVGHWTIENSAIGVISNRFADVTGFVRNASAAYIILKWTVMPKRGASAGEYAIAALPEYTSGPLSWTPSNTCSPLTATGRFVSFTCPMAFGLYTLVRRLDGKKGSYRNNVFYESLGPWVMIASGMCVACLLSACFIHCLCGRRVPSSVKLYHALVNSWVAIVLHLLIFALGIDLVAQETVCMVVAILLHYTTLAILLWIFLVVRTIQRKLHKALYPKKLDTSDDELAAYSDARPKPRHGPLVGMYFLAWGLPAMPCAFTLPLRIDTYTSREEICFIDTSLMALVGFGIPVSILLVVISALLANGSRLQKEWAQRRGRTSKAVDHRPLVYSEGIHCPELSSGPIQAGNSNNLHLDTISYVSTEIGDEDEGGARKHLTTVAMVFSLTVLATAIGTAMVMRIWVIFGLGHLEQYFVLISSSVYATVILALGVVVVWSYVFGRRALREKTIPKATPNARNLDEVAVPCGDGKPIIRRRHRPRSRPPTMTAPVEGHKLDSMVNSLTDPFARFHRGVNAGTVVTRPPSEQSGTAAPSRTNMSTTRSCKAQQAVARKYYEKQRSMKVNSSAIGAEDSGDATKGKQDSSANEKTIGKCNDLKIDDAPISAEEATIEPYERDTGDPQIGQTPRNVSSFDDGNSSKRKPSVELYRKPANVSKAAIVIRCTGQGTLSNQNASDEDSAPEALRCVDYGAYNTDAVYESRSRNDVIDAPRVSGKNETSV